MNPPLGQIGDYQLQSELGRGGMGVVYKAIHQGSGTEVAIKLLINPNHELKARSLIEEAVTGKKVDHPNCLKIYEVLSYGENDSPAIVSEFVNGLNARDFLDLPLFTDQAFVFSPLSATLIFEQMLRGLRAAHNAGLIHQDIKPENFLIEQSAIDAIEECVDDDGDIHHDDVDDVLLGLRDSSWIKLSDWGLSIYKAQERSMGKSLSISLSRIPEEKRGGTLVYMPPEQIDGVGVSRRTDIFALGLVFYELLTGQSAIKARSSAEGISAEALDSAQNFLIQMVSSSAPAAVSGGSDKALKPFRRIPQIPEILESMTMRQKADRIGSKALSDEVDELLEDLLAPPRPFPKAFLAGACVIFLLPFIIWHVIFRLLPPEPKAKTPTTKTPVNDSPLSVSEQQEFYIKRGLVGDLEAMGKIVGLSLAQCKQFAQSSFKRLHLTSLKTLPPEEAAALARFRGEELVLTGLKTLNEESAIELASFFGEKLVIATKTPLEDAPFKALCQFSGDILDVSQQRDFGSEAVLSAGRFSGTLRISPRHEQTVALAKMTQQAKIGNAEKVLLKRLEANSLEELKQRTSLSPNIARALVKNSTFHDKRLLFVNLREITPECAGILRRFKGREIRLTSLTTISAKAARALSGFQGPALTVHTLDDLEPKVMAEFIPYKGAFLTLDAARTLTIDQAKVLSQSQAKQLKLYLLRNAAPGSLLELAKFKGEVLRFTPPMILTATQIAAITTFSGRELQVSVYNDLSEERVKALIRFKGKQLTLMGVGNLTPELATLLCQWPGEELSFFNITGLKDDAAKKLIGFKGSKLAFENAPMAPSTKKILGSFPGKVKFGGN